MDNLDAVDRMDRVIHAIQGVTIGGHSLFSDPIQVRRLHVVHPVPAVHLV